MDGESKLAPPDEGSVLEFMSFVFPDLSASRACPPWPPDVYGIVATVMRRSGAYVRSVPAGKLGDPAAASLLGQGWTRNAGGLGGEWRDSLNALFEASKGKSSFATALTGASVPGPVQEAWDALIARAAEVEIEKCLSDQNLSKYLIQLTAYADEASVGIGLPCIDGKRDLFCSAAAIFLQFNKKLSFCHRLHAQKARVLGKKHTPQQGLTLRSMTHHLSLCMPWEVEAQWYDVAVDQLDDVLNLLLLPWPLEVQARQFRCFGNTSSSYHGDRSFQYRRASMTEIELRQKLDGAIGRALEKVSDIHAIVLPELALTLEEWQVAEEVARKRKVLLISGIIDDMHGKPDDMDEKTEDMDEKAKLPVNSCRIQLGELNRLPGEEDAEAPERRAPAYKQTKHHRWCLDRHQVLQYDLGGQLPSAMRCWEDSYVERRGIFFATLGGWLTFSVLICEDLARQDPIADVMRSVGPNLVVALLMDGPQLTSRWSARYASVLADDPGTSVLTLTSLGMCKRSRPSDPGAFVPSRVVALWKDKLYGSREIALDANATGCVLSLACESRKEYTADGRSDGGATQIPVFSGVFQI